jgi:divalent metal cation (Fe/Co/Zn/Cd) transporter
MSKRELLIHFLMDFLVIGGSVFFTRYTSNEPLTDKSISNGLLLLYVTIGALIVTFAQHLWNKKERLDKKDR